jgi:iron complex outermembrane recepter protein
MPLYSWQSVMIRPALIRRVGLVISGIFFLLLASVARAQTVVPSPTPEAEVERVVVTGSNIPSAEEVGPNPVQIIDREYIEKSGERTLEQLLRDLPVAGANGVPTSNNAPLGSRGASSISLRGFDASATLVLIDGRRVAPYPQGTGEEGTQTFIDLNTIPGPAVESIEILTDGASVIYGADAVAGVVNIKLRHDYRGAEGLIEYGNTLDKDNGEFASSLLFGVGDTNTNVSGVVNYYHRNSIFNRDRGFSNYSQPMFKSSSSNPGQFAVSPEAVLAAGVPSDQIPDSPLFTARPPNGTNGFAPATEYFYYQRRQPLFNTNTFSGSFPDSERYGGFVNFDHKVLGEQLVAYGDFLYQNVRTVNQLAPAPTGPFQAVGQVTIAIPPHAPGATLGGPTYEDTGLPLGAFNPFNPFQQIISGFGSRYRLADFPNRVLVDTNDAIMTTAGLKGDKLFDGSWGYNAAFRYSEIKDIATAEGESTERFNRILNATDPIFDPASSEFIGTTVPYNPFGDYRHRIPSNLQTINFASVQTTDIDSSKMWTVDFTAYTTSLFKLPGGPVGLALGGQYRRENIAQKPDELGLQGDIIGAGGKSVLTVAGRKSFGIYGELNLPFFSPEMKVPGLRSLEFVAAARFEDYFNNNTNILVPKVGMRWQPFDESLTLRATWGEGFREPSLLELHQSPITGFLTVRNPRTHEIEEDVPFTLSSNPNLYPEDSRNFTAGIVYTPKFIPGLTISVDLFGIERQGVVAPPDAQDVVKRNTRGRSLPGESVLYAPDDTFVQINYPFENEGQERARGADFGLQYELGTALGKFTSVVQATYLESFRIALTPTSPALENRSTGDFLKWKGRSLLSWEWKGFDLSTTITYLDGSHEVAKQGPMFPDQKKEHWIHQTFVFDVQGSYAFRFAAPVETAPVAGYSKSEKEATHETLGTLVEANGLPLWRKCLNNTTLTIGCNNVFGQDPPFAFNSMVNYPGSYDAVGRFVYVSLKKKF